MALLWFKWFVPFLLLTPITDKKNEPKPHPFYLSVVEINHNNKDKTLEISCKLFAEDLEEIINKNYKTKLDLTDSKQQDQVNKFINDYIHKHLSLNADGKPLQLNYV